MIERIRRYIAEEQLAEPGEDLWVAVSGGVDSMVLLHVLHSIGHSCSVAHVDHGLRGAESDADKDFVKGYCAQHGIEFHSERVDVAEVVGRTGVSVQMAARELRYAWFDQLILKGPHRLAMAHHSDDAIETLFMNLIQGMGMGGWGAIPARNGPIIRPMLNESRETISAYALENAIPFREDPSNQDSKYLRSRIRHEVLPLLASLRPGALQVLARSVGQLREVSKAAEKSILRSLGTLPKERRATTRLNIDEVLDSGYPHIMLLHVLREKGFHPDRVASIVYAMRQRKTGTVFRDGAHEVLVDRNELVLQESNPFHPEWVFGSLEDMAVDSPLMVMTCLAGDMDLSQGANVAWLDPEAMPFPWRLRVWRSGDRMRPIGLGGSKLISDILIDAKVPRDVKDITYVLESGGSIAWCCGLRIGEGFQAGARSSRVLRCEWKGY